ncbi:MAG: tail fiber domain-containing protein [Paludibacteraceae bacterium]|nr:tail fiber domain-containing protein [Paludibacteraceae bacterium]
MKRKLVICAVIVFACSLFTNVKAQLLVDSTGKVGICLPFDTIKPLSLLSIGHKGFENSSLSVVSTGSIQGLSSWNNICSKNIISQGMYRPQWNVAISGATETDGVGDRLVGVRGNATKSTASVSGRAYGVIGVAGNATSGYNYGTCGFLLSSSTNGSGIYGDIYSFSEVGIPGRYAGFFNGQTRVNGNFYATAVYNTSDSRLKTNISHIEHSSLKKIQDLQPIQFTWNRIENPHCSDTTTVKRTLLSEDLDYKRLHYGFLAQEVQKLYPELVQEDGDGYLSINYIELIPILVQAVQELSVEVEELKKRINK